MVVVDQEKKEMKDKMDVKEKMVEKKETGEPERKRRGIVLCDKVEEISTNGELTQKDLVNEGRDAKEKVHILPISYP